MLALNSLKATITFKFNKIMSKQIIYCNLLKVLRCQRLYSTSTIPNSEEYTPTPKYPEILDLSLEKRKERASQSYAKQIQDVKTVEEKQIKLNMPRYYGFKCYMFEEHSIPYNNLKMTQYLTRTSLIEQDTLPTYYDKIKIEEIDKNLKNKIKEAIILEHENHRRIDGLELNEKENVLSSAICQQINRIVINHLREKYLHLSDTQTDIDPRVESAWFVGGLPPPLNVQKSREGLTWLKDKKMEPVDRAIQYIGKPNLTLRSKLPLLPIVSNDEALTNTFEVPIFKYDLGVSEVFTDYRRLVNIPGFWPGDPYEFGLVSFHKRGHMLKRTYDDDQDAKESIYRQGILGSFGWLSAQANHLGFTTFNDVTYPLVTQCAVTNGKLWSFFVYQLNTMLLHSKFALENPKVNLCWATKELKLFEEIKDGKVIGFNDDTLKYLLKFYANVPEQRLGVELKPYLSQEEKVIADYKDDDKRQWLEKEYKFITSNRPRHYLPYEIYSWEKIYKIDHKTRPMDARRRPFELHVNPWKRTADDRIARYIPRAHRPDLPRHKGRYAKEYFP